MVFWIIGFLVVLVALLIPILAIVLDSPALHKLVEGRRGMPAGEMKSLKERLETLEDEVDDMGTVIRQLREETQFLQRLLEDAGQKPPAQLPPKR
jgi:uncharacterized protein YlxW (UPF0749 family)